MLDRFTKIDVEKLLNKNIKVKEIEMYKRNLNELCFEK